MACPSCKGSSTLALIKVCLGYRGYLQCLLRSIAACLGGHAKVTSGCCRKETLAADDTVCKAAS
jgi:hypothetical protein